MVMRTWERWLNRLAGLLRGRRRGVRGGTRRLPHRVMLEVLEDRVTPSASLQTGGSAHLPFTASVQEGGSAATVWTGNPNNDVSPSLFDFTDPDGTLADYSVTITWGDGTSSTFASTDLTAPALVIANPNGPTGSFQVVPADVQANAHVYEEAASGNNFTVQITDVGTGATTGPVSTPFTAGINVTDPPVVLNSTPLTLTPIQEAASTGQVVVAQFSDPGNLTRTGTDNDSATEYSATIDWGDGTTPTAATMISFAGNDPNTGASLWDVYGTHTYAEESTAAHGANADGTYHIQVSVNHNGVPTPVTGETYTAGIQVVDPPVVLNSTPLTLTAIQEGASTGQVTVAQFSDAGNLTTLGDDSDSATEYTATIDWGDGTTPTDGTVVFAGNDPSTGASLWNVQGAHIYAEESSAAHGANADGTYHIQVSVNHDGVPTPATGETYTAGIQVTDPPIVLSDTPLTLTGSEGASTGTVTVAAFTDPGNLTTTGTDNDSATEYTATIDWGDGSGTTTGTVVFTGNDPSTGASIWNVTGAHAYAEEGSYNIQVSVTHDALAAVGPTQTATITVNDQPLTDLASANLPSSGLEGAPLAAVTGLATFTDPAGVGAEPLSDFTATVNWGDNTTSPGTVVLVSSDAGGAHYRVDAPAHTYAEEGTYTVTVTLTHDALAAVTTPAQTITIADQQIINLTAANLPATTPTGVSLPALTGLATFTDPAGLGVEPSTDFTATVLWGDGSTSPGTVVSLGGGDYRVDAPAHTYSQAGTFSVSVTVQHDALVPVTSNSLSIRVVTPVTVGVYSFGNTTWQLRNSNDPGAPDTTVQYGSVDSIPVMGDWDGNGTTTLGVVDVVANTISTDPNAPQLLQWSLRNSNSPGAPDITFLYGKEGDIPVVGDWNGDGVITVGVFEPDTGVWKLRNSNTPGAPDITFTYGAPGDIPVVGDWNGDGVTTIGVVDPKTMTWSLRNSNSPGAPDITFTYGSPGDIAVTGDWTGSGTTTIGVFTPSTATWQLRNSNSAGAADIPAFQYGASPDQVKPVTGTFATGFLMRAGGGMGAGGSSVPTAAQSDLDAAKAEALTRLTNAGVSQDVLNKVSGATFTIGTLVGPVLARANPNTNQVVVSPDAAGNGWFIDPTPDQDEEFTAASWGGLTALPGSAADGLMDLLTVVLHEMGDLAGLPDLNVSPSGNTLMQNLLGAGNRLTVGLDQIFANAHT